ncbi:S1 family serine peptidase [Echinimonas agarilytica]|uniref:Serine protease n=1 Tax=Echinimonas agarilytica TaxID=1215918 RepID=A0AA41W7H4_9GAMM|nr:serine protease [Echinimonas agarilytica]MCM2680161.1 serine protease [Echinimonas agarilytica]
MNILKSLSITIVLITAVFTTCKAAASAQEIIGGGAFDGATTPWMASLSYIGRNGRFINQPQHLCGGLHIAPQWILTAAHCVYGEGFRADELGIIIGIDDLDQVSRSNVLRISQFMIHPDYNADTQDSDVALIRLQASASNTDFAQLSDNALTDQLQSGALMTIVGWGEIDDNGTAESQLQGATIDYVSPRTCMSDFRSVGLSVTDTMICAGGTGTGTCFGDSGGPIFDDQGVAHGIVSWGVNCQADFASVFSRIASFRTWINSSIAGVTALSPQFFGVLPEGAESSQPIIILNNGSSVSTISDVSLQGDGYSISNNDCSSAILAQGDECSVSVHLLATDSNLDDGVLMVSTSTGDIAVRLTAHIAELKNFDDEIVPDGIDVFTYGRFGFKQSNGTLQANLTGSVDNQTELLFQAVQAGTLSFVVNLSGDSQQLLTVGALNAESSQSLGLSSSGERVSTTLAKDEVLQVTYQVGDDAGTATISSIIFESDEPIEPTPEPSSSSSSGGGGAFSFGLLLMLYGLGWCRRAH